jgi:DNA-binding GntR family transcriptional regulator
MAKHKNRKRAAGIAGVRRIQQPVTVHTQTAERIRNAILTGAFRPGERLVESDLCKQMGVSRTSIREALRRLEAERLITIPPNRGPIVTEISWEDARQIYDVRALLEGEAAALFAAIASAAALKDLKFALKDFERAAAANTALGRLKAAERFYEVILDGCGNRIIAELLRGLTARITFLRARSMSRPARSKFSAAEMARIYKAIEAGDEQEARRAAIDHVNAAANAARTVFEVRDDLSRRIRRSPIGPRLAF